MTMDAHPFRWLGLCPGDPLTVRPYTGSLPYAGNVPPGDLRVAAALDTETTGIDVKKHRVIEIGIRVFTYSCATGAICKIIDEYDAFQDPGEPLSEEIMEVTGITNEMVAGQSIDLSRVRRILESANIIIAHHAAFDRPFTEKLLGEEFCVPSKVWACSIDQIDWYKHGLPSAKLQALCWLHGFYNNIAHRAGADASTLVRLLATQNAETGKTYLCELLEVSRLPWFRVSAHKAPFESKDMLKRRGYRWGGDSNKVWSRIVVEPKLEEEMAWLQANAYGGGVCRAGTKVIEMTERFR